jgi:hypothetical protein
MIFVGLPLVIAFVMFYFPQKYLTRLIINDDKNVLEKVKKGQVLEIYELNSIMDFRLKKILSRPGKYKLLLDKIDGSSVEIFNEDSFLGNHWKRFAENLSFITNKPLKEEIWQEDFDGKLIPVSPEDLNTNKKKGILRLAVPLCVSLIGAIYCRLSPSKEVFIFAGLITVLINISLSFYYVLKNKKDFGRLSNNTIVLVIYVLTLLIPYFSFYILFVYLLNGFQLM